MNDDNWKHVKAWRVPADKLPEFLKRLQEASSPFSACGIPDGSRFARDVSLKSVGDGFIVTARTCLYPYVDNRLEEFLRT